MFEVFITFIAGMVSFLSPCVLPLVPAYIGYMSGRMTNTVAAQVTVNADGSGTAVMSHRPYSARFNTFLHGLAFVAGFTFIFVMLGVLSTAIIRPLLGGEATVTAFLGRTGGVIVIFLGFHFMGVLPPLFNRLRKAQPLINHAAFSIIMALIGSILILWCATGTLAPWQDGDLPRWTIGLAVISVLLLISLMAAGGAFTTPGIFWTKAMNTLELTLYADTRREMVANGQQGFANSAFMGIVFAAGWTPCLGPTLGTALGLAIAGENASSVIRGGVLLGAYSLGLGIPFLLTALMLDGAQGIFRRLQGYMRSIQLVSGVFLVFIGYLIASGQLQSFSLRLSQDFGDFSYSLEECTIAVFEGDLRLNQFDICMNGEQSIEDLKDDTAFLPNMTQYVFAFDDFPQGSDARL